ncbi:MAG: hypothetical protein J6M17_07835 [Ruminococcus sp.]|nr:hypothetical protein [Ruminococcus sp.]
MNYFRETMFICCICAVLSSAVRMISPDKLKKEMNLICTLLIIVCTASSFAGYRINLNEKKLYSERDRTADYNNIILEQTAESMKQELEHELKSKDITVHELVIDCSYDEYNYIKADKVLAVINEANKCMQAEKIIRDKYSGCTVEVTS